MLPTPSRRRSWFGAAFAAGGMAMACLAMAWAADVPRRISLLPTGGPGAATNLFAKPDCDRTKPGRAVAYLHWTPAIKKGTEQRVAVTIVPKGFDAGMFSTSPTVASNATNYVWDRLEGQAIHFWRVLTLQPEGWISSEGGSFRGPTCVQDMTDQPAQPQPRLNKPEGKP